MTSATFDARRRAGEQSSEHVSLNTPPRSKRGSSGAIETEGREVKDVQRRRKKRRLMGGGGTFLSTAAVLPGH